MGQNDSLTQRRKDAEAQKLGWTSYELFVAPGGAEVSEAYLAKARGTITLQLVGDANTKKEHE